DWGEFPRTPDLHVNIFDLRNARPRCIFVSNRPARSLAGKAELPVQSRTVDLDHDSINFVRQAFALLLPFADESPHFVEVRGQRATRVNLESGILKRIQCLPMLIE